MRLSIGESLTELCGEMMPESVFFSRVINGLASHEALNVPKDRMESITSYARRALALGAPFDGAVLNKIQSMTEDEIAAEESRLTGKLSPAAYQSHLEAVARRRKDERLDTFFGGQTARYVNLVEGFQSIDERVDEAIANPRGPFAGCTMRRVPGKRNRIEATGTRNQARQFTIGKVLREMGYWELEDDRQQLSEAERPSSLRDNYESLLASRSTVSLDGVKSDRFRVAFSRFPKWIGEASSGQRWNNCFTEGGQNFSSLAAHIAHGSMVAYLIDADDVYARYPYGRCFLIPYKGDHGGIIYFADQEQGAWCRTYKSPIRDHFRKTVMDVARELSDGSPAGIYRYTDNAIYINNSIPVRRIVEWESHDLCYEIRNIAQQRLRHPIERIRECRRIEEEELPFAQYRHDLTEIYKCLENAENLFEHLASAAGNEAAVKLIEDTRNCYYSLTRSGICAVPKNIAYPAMLDGFRAWHSKYAPAAAVSDRIEDFDAAISGFLLDPVPGDIFAALLREHIWPHSPHLTDKDEWIWPRLENALGTITSGRRSHIIDIGRTMISVADGEEYESFQRFKEIQDEIDALKKCFNDAWWALRRAIGEAYGQYYDGPAAKSLECDIRRVGIKQALLNLQANPKRYVTIFDRIYLAIRTMRKRTDWRSLGRAVSEAASVMPGIWQSAHARLLNHPNSSRILNINAVLFDLMINDLLPRDEPLNEIFIELAYSYDEPRPIHEILAYQEHSRRNQERDFARGKRLEGQAVCMTPLESRLWLGATAWDLRRFAWVPTMKVLRRRREKAMSEARKNGSVEELAFSTFKILRRKTFGKLPGACELIMAAREVIRQDYCEIESVKNAGYSPHL